MSKRLLWILVLSHLTGSLFAQDISGDWQGTLKAGASLRFILHVTKGDSGEWNVFMASIDQTPDWGAGIPASSVSLQGDTLKINFDAARAIYEGKLNAAGNTLTGTFSQLSRLPLEFQRPTKETAWTDPSPHTAQKVTVDKNVNLEVLDWGGSGRPLVFLAGLGNTAHVFDKFAPKFTDTYHVYGVTRRGFGASSVPASGYSADRLGDDVLAVLDSLKLNRPVLVGHSIAGQELSSIGTRHPERIAGLIYLDAGYAYAYYDRSRGDLGIDSLDLQRKLEKLRQRPPDAKQLIDELLQTTLPQFEKDLREMQKDLQTSPAPPAGAPPISPVMAAIQAGLQKYTDIKSVALAIYAVPHELGPGIPDQAARAAAEASDTARTEAQAKAFEAGVPTARVVRLPRANHYVFLSNEADVLREMHSFLGSLP